MIWQTLLQELSAVLQVNPGALNLDVSFVQNGGHSLSAVDWAARLKKQGIFISVGQVLSCSNLNELFKGLLLPLESEADGQIPPEFSDNGAIPSSTSSPCLSTPPSSDVTTTDGDSLMGSQFLLSDALMDESTTVSLSEMQASLLHGSLKNPGTNIIHHHETYPTRIIPRFKEAWKAVLEAEPIFQSSTLLLPGQAQEIFVWKELTVDTAAEYHRQLQAVPVESSTSSFTVIHRCYEGTSDARTTIIWTVHHALVDGYSAMLLFHKVRRVVAGLSVSPGPSFSQIEQQINTWRRTHKAEGDEYWSKQASLLQQAQGDPLLPEPQRDHVPTPPTQSEEVLIASNTLQARLQIASQELGVTPATFYYAAWAFVLSLYTDSGAVVFGAVMAGRNLPLHGIDEVVGPLINTLPLCIKLDERQSVRDCLRSLFSQVVELAEYQWTTPNNGYSRTFASAMAMQVPEPDFPDGPLPLEPPYTRQTMDVPLSINIMTNGAARFIYHTARYSPGDMTRISNYFHRALQLLLRPHQTVKECMQGMLDCGDLETLMTFGNCHSGLTTAITVQEDLVTLFESAASRHPAAIALRKGSHELEYQELDASASRVAVSLRNHISDGDVVCLHADRSMHWIVGMMGILKAGGVLCAVDAALPPEARDVIFAASGASVFLVPNQADKHLQPSACEFALVIAEILESDQTPLAPRRLPRPADNAYLCFTSGSTGKPKGVMCSHEGLVAFQRDLEVRLFAQPGQHIAQTMSVAFDGSIHEIFSALSYGASLVLQSGGDPFAHLHDVDAAILTPSMARVLDPADFERLATVYLVGEPVPIEVADKWAQHKTLYNMYGPTEGTCGATIKRLLPQQQVTIGPPNPSTRLYIMNRQQELLPPGVLGEIYIAGVQVARGYIGMPQQTAERFLPDPIRKIGERMYRTGDRGYWTSNGEVVCLGRSDRQIKLRGFRLDLDDLEARMVGAVPAVTAVAVSRQGDHLIAAVLPASVDVHAFAARVAQILPPYAIPRKIVALDDFPTTKAGKRDYQALAKMSIKASAAIGRPLHTPLERTVGNAFRDVLRLAPDTRLNTYSSFRELGGHSLLQLLLVTRLSQAVGRQVPLRLVVQHDRIEQLASAIEKGPSLPLVLALDANTLGESTLSPMEQEWWQKYQAQESTSSFNVSFMAKIDSDVVDRVRLADACNAVLSRHRILRSRYVFSQKSRTVRRQYSHLPPRVRHVKVMDPWIEINRPFALAHLPPIRAALSRSHLILTMSHIIADLTTMQILLREISTHYRGGTLPCNSQSYMNSTLWQDKPTSCDLIFWSECLGEQPLTTHLLGHAVHRRGYHGTSAFCEIPQSVYQAMLGFFNQFSITPQQLALAAVALCLDDPSTVPPSTDIVLGLPYINRKSNEDLDVVGLFLEPLPVRIRYSPGTESGSYLHSVQSSVRASVSHAIHWDQLLSHLQAKSTPPDHPLFETVVTFHSRSHSNGLELSVPGFQTCYTFPQGAKFRLLCEFSALSEDKLLLRMEYDRDCFSEDDIWLIQRRISLALALLVQDVPYERIRDRLVDLADVPEPKILEADKVFGIPLADI